MLSKTLQKIFLSLSFIASFLLIAPAGILAASLPTEKQFTGHVFDQSSDLYYMRARYYDPVIGRFIQPDSIIPFSDSPDVLNRYMYVRNNPLRLIDPSGNQVIGLEGEKAEYWQRNQMAIFDVVGGGFVVEGGQSLAGRGIRWALNTRVGRALTSKIDDLIVRVVPSYTIESMAPSGWGPAAEGIIPRETQIYQRMVTGLETKHGAIVEEGVSRAQAAELLGEKEPIKETVAGTFKPPNRIFIFERAPEVVYEEALHLSQYRRLNPVASKALDIPGQTEIVAFLHEMEASKLYSSYYRKIYGRESPPRMDYGRRVRNILGQLPDEYLREVVDPILDVYSPGYIHHQLQIDWLQEYLESRLGP